MGEKQSLNVDSDGFAIAQSGFKVVRRLDPEGKVWKLSSTTKASAVEIGADQAGPGKIDEASESPSPIQIGP
jgi:hypothetical protein